jgi:prepilin-type N-terminal cleavage/methylation domain-containing protein
MNTPANRSKDSENGFTLVEVMVAAILVAIFFASLFELNAMCLRYIDSSKESLAALQSVQDRAEALRNRSFYDLTRTTCDPCVNVPPAPPPQCVTTPCVHDLMATAANPAPIAQRFTEVVTISNYPATANGVTQYTRSPDGIVAMNSQRTDPVTSLVQVDVSVSWTTTLGGRARTEQTSCIVSDGTKK